jgi:D-serine dehydratase
VAFTFRASENAGYRPGLRLLAGDVEFPQLVLKRAELQHNIAAMSAFCAARDISIAPHAKTSMAPAIIRRQLDAGAWGMTVATMSQLRVCLEAGVPRILLANELVNPAAAAWLGEALSARPGPARAGPAVYCIADSAAGVSRLAEGWRMSGCQRPLPVLVEVGVPAGRTGCRTPAEAEAVARAVARHPELSLAGVEAFEGILGSGRSAEDLGRVDAFLHEVTKCAERLDRLGLLADATEVVLSAGGSLYFDRVSEALRAARLSRPYRVVIRSGCYAFHDHAERAGEPLLAGADGATELIPALQLCCEVVSVPEPGLAIAGFGKRDAPYDGGLPVVLGRLTGENGTLEPCADLTVTGLNDQHAFISVGPSAHLAVGDRLACGIIHPCTAFDKWRRLALVDENYRVLETIDTFF